MGSSALSEFYLTLLAGRTIEHAVKDAIKQRYAVLMTANMPAVGGAGPRMENSGAGITLADMQLYGGVRSGWVEVKAKSRPLTFYTWGREEHGIDFDKLKHYEHLQVTTRQTIYLLVCEVANHTILMQSLDTLKSVGKPRVGSYNGKQMINWDRSSFVVVGELCVPAEDLRNVGVTIHWPTFETFVTQPLLLDDIYLEN